MGIQNSTFTCHINWIPTPKQGVLKSLALTLMLAMLWTTAVWSQNVNVTATGGTLMANYTTLKGAFDVVNAGTRTGTILIDIAANTTETESGVLNSSGAGSASYTSILIRPTVDGVTVSGPTVTGRGLIEFNGADNVTLDGDNPNSAGTNRNLTITNTAANTITYTMAVRIAVATSVITSANNMVIKNCNVNGSATGRNVSGGLNFDSWRHSPLVSKGLFEKERTGQKQIQSNRQLRLYAVGDKH